MKYPKSSFSCGQSCFVRLCFVSVLPCLLLRAVQLPFQLTVVPLAIVTLPLCQHSPLSPPYPTAPLTTLTLLHSSKFIHHESDVGLHSSIGENLHTCQPVSWIINTFKKSTCFASIHIMHVPLLDKLNC